MSLFILAHSVFAAEQKDEMEPQYRKHLGDGLQLRFLILFLGSYWCRKVREGTSFVTSSLYVQWNQSHTASLRCRCCMVWCKDYWQCELSTNSDKHSHIEPSCLKLNWLTDLLISLITPSWHKYKQNMMVQNISKSQPILFYLMFIYKIPFI